MFFIGLIWAALAPLLMLIPIGVLYTLSPRTPLARKPWFMRWRKWLCTAAVLLPVTLVWLQDRAEFHDICAANTTLKITQHDKAAGFFLDDGTANSFGMRYLQEEGFEWFEAVDYRNRSKFVRYVRDGNTIRTDDIAAPTARYEVRAEFSQRNAHTTLNITRVINRETGVELAHAGMGQFSGGRAMWLLGAWGSAGCPSPGTPEWSNTYHLANLVLQ
jgi:hypothetical protein